MLQYLWQVKLARKDSNFQRSYVTDYLKNSIFRKNSGNGHNLAKNRKKPIKKPPSPAIETEVKTNLQNSAYRKLSNLKLSRNNFAYISINNLTKTSELLKMLGYQGLKETIIIRVIGVIRKDSVLLKISDKIYSKK